MHELSITEHLLEDCIREAQKQNARKIRVIRLCIGQLKGIVPECIQVYLDMLSEGTIAEGAQIEAEFLPVKVLCRDCGQTAQIDRAHIECPYCHGLNLKRLSGNECMIESLEVD